MKSDTRVLIYLRVSTKKQEEKNQLLQLQEYCKAMNYSVVEILTDKISGADPSRPGLKKMFEMASKRKFDILLFWSLSRLSREGVRRTIFYLSQLESYGVGFKSYTEQYLDTTGVFKDAVISILASMAEQEKIRLSESVKAGLERVKKQGKKLGRPVLKKELKEKIQILGNENLISYRQIAKKLNISDHTVKKYLEQNKPKFKK